MAMRKVEYYIEPDGNVRVEVICVPGNECAALTENVENRLGDLIDREYKSEYYQQPIEQDNAQKTQR